MPGEGEPGPPAQGRAVCATAYSLPSPRKGSFCNATPSLHTFMQFAQRYHLSFIGHRWVISGPGADVGEAYLEVCLVDGWLFRIFKRRVTGLDLGV